MTINAGLRLVAGIAIIISLLLTHLVHPNFVYFTVFVALNLIQSAFTLWCPMVWLLSKLGLKKEVIA